MLDFDAKYAEYLKFFNDSLNKRLSLIDCSDTPDTIKSAMKYAVSDGGKRVRPILCYAAAEMLCGSVKDVEELALAIEFIHSYSLVHDDLPCMDNDDYRRGKLSTHKKFGEAMGVLAGDALLNYAFEILLSKNDVAENYVRAAGVVAEFAGFSGMIGGQIFDIENEKKTEFSERDLYDTYINKTAKLITAPLLAASLCLGGQYHEELKEFGYNLGVLFQITDDLLDLYGTKEEIGKTPHKDDAENKLTAIRVFGVDGAKAKAEQHYRTAKEIIAKIDGVGFLTAFTDKMYSRKK